MSGVHSALDTLPATTQVPSREHVATVRAPKLLSVPAICQRFGIHRETWRRWVKSRQAPLPIPNLPGHPKWDVRDIEHFERGRFAGRVR